MRAFPEGGSGIKGPCLCLRAFVIFFFFYWKTKAIEMHKLIWSLLVTIVNTIIVLINEAAVVVPVPLPSFVTSENQNRWHCCGSSAFLLKRNLLNCNHISFCDNQCDLSKSGSSQPNSHKATFHWRTNDPPITPANICFC